MDLVHYVCTIKFLNLIYTRSGQAVNRFRETHGQQAEQWHAAIGLTESYDIKEFMCRRAKQYWIRKIYLRDLSKAPRVRKQIVSLENDFLPYQHGTILVHSASQFSPVLRATIRANGGMVQQLGGGQHSMNDAQKTFAFSKNLKDCLATLQNGGTVVMTPEGRHGTQGITLDFMGRPYCFLTGFARLALLSKAQIVPVNISMQPNGRLKMWYEPAWEWTDTPSVTCIMKRFAHWLSQRWVADPGSVDPHYMDIYLQEISAKER